MYASIPFYFFSPASERRMGNLTWHVLILALGLLSGILINSYTTVQLKTGTHDHQIRHIDLMIEEAKSLEQDHIKLYFGIYKSTKDTLLARGYNLTYYDQDEDCLRRLSVVREGSPEYYQVIHQRGCHRMYTPYVEINWRPSA
jgi:hypothetical protein